MKIAEDKKMHYTVGIMFSFIVTALAATGGNDSIYFEFLGRGILYGFFSGVLLGASKELIYDKLMKRGTPEWMDFVWTVFGTLSGIGIVLILKLITLFF